MVGSNIFRRNRALGYVSNHIPAVIRYVQRRKDHLIITCIGRAFQVYTASHFRLLHVSDIHPNEITCLVVDRNYTYTASDKCIYAWRAGKHIRHIYKGHTKDVHLLLPFRDYLIAIDDDNYLKVWSVESETVYLEIPFPANTFRITAISHPPTYINKILIGSEQGSLQLWNIKRGELIYTFDIDCKSKITVIESTPALDVAAVGYQNGEIVLLNLKLNIILMKFNQEWGPVTKISFRTDGHPIMATSSTNGHIAFWNLEKKKIFSQLTAHENSVTTTICLPNEPLMLTTSPDNSMKLWIFDMPDGGPRLLRIREGHSAPPLHIRYHGLKGENIISSGEDSSLRIFSTVSETLNKSMGRASYNRKASKKKNRLEDDPLIMPPIIKFTSEVTREKEWDNIAAIHTGIIQTTIWSFHKQKMGEHRLIPEKFFNKNRKDFNTECTCLTLTHCGNFVIIGYSSGDVERFNIQSGIHRATYGKPAHKAAVRGVACDNLNQTVITGDSDGIIKFWNFKENTHQNIAKLVLNFGVTMFETHRESGMIAVGLDNFSIYILDSETKVIIRKFFGHTAKLNDIAFSPDSRWLLSSSMDSTIKVWDIPSSYMIDHFKVERPCTSLTISPTGDFLATTHVNYLGVYLWSNKTLFNHISLRSINPYSEAPYIDLPSNRQDENTLETAVSDLNIENDDNYDDGEQIDLDYKSPEQITSELITLSGLTVSRWQNLLDLDTIKKRNKPKTTKIPKQAPFFLPTIAGTELKFDFSNVTAETENSSKIKVTTDFNNLTAFGKLLEETISIEKSSRNDDITTTVNDDDNYSEQFERCFNYLKSLGPSMTDFEIRSLHPIGGGNYKIMLQFLKMIVHMFSTNTNFELCESYLALFLKIHGTTLNENTKLYNYLEVVEKAQEKCWKILEDKLLYGIGVVSGLRNFAC